MIALIFATNMILNQMSKVGLCSVVTSRVGLTTLVLAPFITQATKSPMTSSGMAQVTFLLHSCLHPAISLLMLFKEEITEIQGKDEACILLSVEIKFIRN